MDVQGKGMAGSNDSSKDEKAVNRFKTGDVDQARKDAKKCF